jgi:hypothetical protein
MQNPFYKNKYIAILLKPVGSGYDWVGKQKLKPTQDKLVLKGKEGKTIPLDYEKIGYRKGVTHVLFVDIVNATLLDFSKHSLPIPMEILDAILTKGSVGDIVSRFEKNTGKLFPFTVALVILLLGVFVGYFLGSVLPYQAISYAISHFHF